MATDVDVQFFSHLNGLTLGNNWGDMIRLLDKALVNGIDFTQITAASIDTQGDVHITLYSAHNAMLFQVVELSGFTPASLNQKYRIKGVPNTTQLILKPKLDITERSITTIGAGKLSALGYDIIFRDAADVKRVYRAKNPTAQHPFIRVDESIASDTGSYTSTYAKYAMVGLLEHMNHIDDYQNPSVLQLPLDPSDPAKNWKITATGTTARRGWSRWYWARNSDTVGYSNDNEAPSTGSRSFTICGDSNAFYLQTAVSVTSNGAKGKIVNGTGLFNDPDLASLTPSWFLMSTLADMSANYNFSFFYLGTTFPGILPLSYADSHAKFLILKKSLDGLARAQTQATPILIDNASGASSKFNSGEAAFLTVPFGDVDKYIRGTLPHILYSSTNITGSATKPLLAGNQMYVTDVAFTVNLGGGFGYYLGELE